MRIRITLDRELVREVDERVGSQERSSFIADAVGRALADATRWDRIESSFGSISRTGHEWDSDPAAWVREQRRGAAGRVG